MLGDSTRQLHLTSLEWVQLCDDFVTLEGECALLCELLIAISTRDAPLDVAAQHGVSVFTTQLKHRLSLMKQALYRIRSDDGPLQQTDLRD